MNNYETYKEFANHINEQMEHMYTLRGLLEFTGQESISIDEVESVETILKRFATGAMSFGSISKEEIEFFSFLVNESDLDIIHKEFIVNVKANDELDQGIVKYDGYLKTDDGIILIEYDGLYWHNQSYDEIKDRITLELRNDILGIIRVSCETFKRKKNKITNLIHESIELK